MADRANIALSRKYRPKTVAEYLNDNFKRVFDFFFKDESKYPQTILLYGKMGCGKTTAARLLTKEYLCLNKYDGHACNECEICRDIDERVILSEAGYNHEAIIEVDIATDSGKARLEQVIEEALVEPIYPFKYKILILDECHMATPQAQNMLLKLVEEPPRHLVIIFSTTNPEKMIPTLRSRCQMKFEVQRPSEQQLVKRMEEICLNEGVSYDKRILKKIYYKANGIPREALNILEEMIKTGSITKENYEQLYGGLNYDLYRKFYEVIEQKRLNDILIYVNELVRYYGMELIKFVNSLVDFTLNAVYARMGIVNEDIDKEFLLVVKKVFNTFSEKKIMRVLEVLEELQKSMGVNDRVNELLLINAMIDIAELREDIMQKVKDSQELKMEDKQITKALIEYESKKLDDLSNNSLGINDDIQKNFLYEVILNEKLEILE